MFWLPFVTIFLLYANKETKSRSQERHLRLNNNNLHGNGNNLLRAACPAIPKCHWYRFEPLQLKMAQGAQSSVSVLIDNFNKEPVIKKIFSDKNDFVNELKALTCLRVGHNPLLVYPLCVDPMKMILVLEWGGDGDLTKWELFRHETVKYSYSDVVDLAAQMIAAVAAAHRRGYLHGDVKPENFVVDIKKKTLKLIDFGLSAKIGDYRVMTQGTPQTMAPEVAFLDFFVNRLKKHPNNQKRDFVERAQVIKEAMDWWSVGVTIHYLFYKFYEEESNRIKSEAEAQQTGTDSSSSDSDDSNFDRFESDDHYFPYKIVWTTDGKDISDFQFRPIHQSFTPALNNLLGRLMAWDPETRNFNQKRIENELMRHELFAKVDWNRIDSTLSK